MVPSKKEDLRKSIGVVIAAIPKETLREKNRKLSQNIATFFNRPSQTLISIIQRMKFLGGFAPLRDEADWMQTWPFASSVLSLAFPAPSKAGEIAFFDSSPEDLEVQMAFGRSLRIPPKGAQEVIPEVLLVPGRAFSREGGRLGRGGGHYDRYLSHFAGLKIGLCFEEQIVKSIPLESHDIPVDWIITERKVFHCTGERRGG